MSLTIIKKVVLFDGLSLHQDSTIILDAQSGLIVAVLSDGQENAFLDDSQASLIIDGSGYTLIPGLIDAHIHCYDVHLPPGRDNSALLTTPLKCGVTTVCDMHSEPRIVNDFRSKVESDVSQARSAGVDGRVTMADLKSSLLAATIKDGWPKPIVLAHHPSEELEQRIATWPDLTVDSVPEFVKSHKAEGADYIKLMQDDCTSLIIPTGSIPCATVDFQQAVVDAAHAEGLIAIGHATSVASTEIILRAGADGLAHTFIDRQATEEVLGLYAATGAFVVGTLVALSGATGDEQELREMFSDLAFRRGIIDEFTRQTMVVAGNFASPNARLEFAYDSIRKLKQNGTDVIAGSDSIAGLKGTAVGPSLWMELHILIERCGFTPLEALNAATAVTARRFGFHDRGIIEKGRRADLVLVKGDISKDLSCLWKDGGISYVWKDGIQAQL